MIVTKCTTCKRMNFDFGVFNKDMTKWITSPRREYCKHEEYQAIRMVEY